jgi:pimeloyl-ACP methyl ester carboxylesterase
MKRAKRFLLAVLAVFLVALVATLAYWITSTKGPSQIALDSLSSIREVRVSNEAGLITFEPLEHPASTGLVFYPGAGVDFRSYAPLLREIASKGFLVAVPDMPLNIAFLGRDAADDVILKFPDIQAWAVGGHSLGGVVAAYYASAHSEVSGLVLWASYPADSSLRHSSIAVLSIYGSQDGLTTPDDIASSRALLPPGTSFVEISGGNHAQFGSYGSQNGDGTATIPAEAQWAIIVDETASFLEKISK